MSSGMDNRNFTGEPVASPQATRPPCNVGVVVDDRIKPCTLEHGHYGKHHADLAAQPAAGTTPQGAMDVERYANHKNAQAVAHKYGLDPAEESFAKTVGAILYVTKLGLEVRDAWKERAEAAEAKLAEHGIVWEEGKGYVFNGKE